MSDFENRIHFALAGEDENRIHLRFGKNGEVEIVLDVHGLKCREAERVINNLINIVRCRVCLSVIHGYNHGTAIKEMIARLRNRNIDQICPDKRNPGLTRILTAA